MDAAADRKAQAVFGQRARDVDVGRARGAVITVFVFLKYSPYSSAVSLTSLSPLIGVMKYSVLSGKAFAIVSMKLPILSSITSIGLFAIFVPSSK